MAFKKSFSKTHKDVTVSDCGIYICKDIPFVAGSPDRMVTCSFCGTSCLEVKCPFSINHKSPTDEDVSLPFSKKNEEGTLVLNRNHKYHTQCQVQMFAAQVTTAYFLSGLLMDQ